MCTCPSCFNPCSNCSCGSTLTASCPVQLDFTCVFYHKSNSEISELDGLGLVNGSSLELVIETIDEKIKQLKVSDFSLPCLRADYVINTFQQFAQSVDTKLCLLEDDVAAALAGGTVSITANDSTTFNFTTSGILNHTITGSVKVSATSPNLIDVLFDGLYVAPPTLSVNYTDKTLTISDGNTVDLTSLLSGVGAFLGNLAADPIAVDGQYWYRTDTDALKIKLNGSVREITIV